MASMRRLNRRLLRWQRYDGRYRAVPRAETALGHTTVKAPPGYARALFAVLAETERRFWDETPEIWLGGPEGEAALIADVLDYEPYCVTCGGPCRDDDGHWSPS